MSRWKALPAELDPRVRQLVVRLRRVKDHSGLSLPQLAAKTGYSPKSWERYLGGRSLPPRDAVEAMALIGGDDPIRLLALHEVAAEAWGDNRKGASAPETTLVTGAVRENPQTVAAKARPHGRSLRVALVALAVALVLAVSSAVLLVVRFGDGDGRAAARPHVSSAVPTSAPGSQSQSAQPTYTCRVERIDGRWYADNSRTQGAVLANGSAGPEVAEAQCLLRRAGFAPGVIDGIFGPHTERAVRHAQKRAGLVVDGIIGPHTWKALRG
ncbi:peptidoglycan-binding protein [Streptomyces acidicola]|uniref:Helix-turn-helix domain-containing protein n=1 Tax=Streptomyces acidicola TaxID=2596892 RepID=A0A5N8X055_9ACTN|nr:peptidoglycan-binding protein [Streptomyces acidicola]MPY52208.1 helix-turn-helix domain-containing protein [Streptomyces acidicola]